MARADEPAKAQTGRIASNISLFNVSDIGNRKGRILRETMLLAE